MWPTCLSSYRPNAPTHPRCVIVYLEGVSQRKLTLEVGNDANGQSMGLMITATIDSLMFDYIFVSVEVEAS